MSCKSAIYAINRVATPVAIDGIIPLNETIRRFGQNIMLSGSSIQVQGRGYYEVSVSVSALVAAAGDVTVSLLADGALVPGATATATAGAAADIVNVSFPAMIRNRCDCDTVNLTLQLSDSAVTTQNVAVVVEKV